MGYKLGMGCHNLSCISKLNRDFHSSSHNYYGHNSSDIEGKGQHLLCYLKKYRICLKELHWLQKPNQSCNFLD
ncbi:unnamed protein product [Blepharisma stoltei]|uniref:Uncharacterized protein n=1 Tax=Blepharisma stoltei TaxID=1481888 RepID=A0AAU9IF01_9CILI|nr:unnamed protein product [Blepharisma stoltei]